MYNILASVQATQLPRMLENLNGYYKELKRKAKESDFASLQHSLREYYETIQMLLVAVNYCLARKGHSSHEQSAAASQKWFSTLNHKMDDIKSRLESTPSERWQNVFTLIKSVIAQDSKNKHFDIPQSVSSIFTGRQKMLDNLGKWMFDESREAGTLPYLGRNGQKRFVLFGLAGSGKTQFCCKFAQEHRERFWGVFWIDASTQDRAEHALSSYAQNVGYDANPRSAKRWFQQLENPWLLIIDQADDLTLDLEALMPEGKKGHMIITTMNPAHKTQGTIGNVFFDFSPGEPENADMMLLRAASAPQPWSNTVRECTVAIVSYLGYLPLAITIAGKTILKGQCTLAEYLEFHENDVQRTRSQIQRRKPDPSRQPSQSPGLAIYFTCELMYEALLSSETQVSRDAVELLNIFSFLKKDNMSFNILYQAATNPILERTDSQEATELSHRTGWKSWIQYIVARLYETTMLEPPRLVLLDVLSDYFNKWRLRDALSELVSRSLIMYHADRNTYLVHAIIHQWIRDRPQMRTADQAVWCEAAATMLSQAILLPNHPSGAKSGGANNGDYRRALLPHVVSVLTYQQAIRHQFERNYSRKPGISRLPLGSRMNRTTALRMVKYSFVFIECARFKEALDLQSPVQQFLYKMLGPNHEKTIKINLAVAQSYWFLGRGPEAAKVQQEALQSSKYLNGADHLTTLRLMDMLATTFWMLGRLKEALALHKAAISGLEKTLAPNHEDVLRAKDHLGRVETKYYRFDAAYALHTVAVDGLKEVLGEEDDDTLIALDNLSNVLMELGGSEQLARSQQIAEEILTVRKRILGAEHYYTLWSGLNLARVKAKRGPPDEAEADIQARLIIAHRTLGADHLGVLNARTFLGKIMGACGETEEAIIELQDVSRRQATMPSAVRGLHPDLIQTLYVLGDCYRRAARYDDGINTITEAIKVLKEIGGHEHPLMQKLQTRRDEIARERDTWLRARACTFDESENGFRSAKAIF